MEICSRNKCAGCYACVNICPVHCISMQEDTCGFIYPIIDETKCIHCKSCRTVCFNNHEIQFKIPKNVFAAWSSDDTDRNTSSSGGLASVFSTYVKKKDGIVFGAAWNVSTQEVSHVCITEEEDIQKLKKSKYVHSYIGETFKQCKSYLLSGKTVLFIGTPCQIEGLHSYLQREYDTLYTIDIVCHGVPAHKMLQDHIQHSIQSTNFRGMNISFRDNTNFKFVLSQKNTILYEKAAAYDLYLKAFLDTAIFRENCYQCSFARPERVSDITLGDFWGLKKELSQNEYQQGISCVLVNSNKGRHLFQAIKQQVVFYERTLEEVVAGNDQLRQPALKNSKRWHIMNLIKEGKLFDDAVRQVYRKELLKQTVKDNIKKIDTVIHIPVIETMLKIRRTIRGKRHDQE